jgi:UDP-N-acetyl-D-mannosaminuronate dehydrogenase
VLVHDPLFTPEEIERLGLRSASLEPPPEVDVVLIQSYHAAYRQLDFGSFPRCKAILDGRNVLLREEIEAKGIKYLGIGR